MSQKYQHMFTFEFCVKKVNMNYFQTFLFKISFYCLLLGSSKLKILFRIHDILVCIRMRMRILGSVPLALTNETDSASCFFSQ
jgi:hypothetical protein